MKTYSAKKSEINKKWLLIDAKDVVLGRLASEVAKLLKGKHKPVYTPHLDCGDNVVIINAAQVYLTGNKADLNSGKLHYYHTGYRGGIKQLTLGKMLLGKHPEKVIKLAVKGMLKPSSALGKKLMSNLRVYSTTEHPHAAQQPELYDFGSKNQKNSKR